MNHKNTFKWLTENSLPNTFRLVRILGAREPEVWMSHHFLLVQFHSLHRKVIHFAQEEDLHNHWMILNWSLLQEERTPYVYWDNKIEKTKGIQSDQIDSFPLFPFCWGVQFVGGRVLGFKYIFNPAATKPKKGRARMKTNLIDSRKVQCEGQKYKDRWELKSLFRFWRSKKRSATAVQKLTKETNNELRLLSPFHNFSQLSKNEI